MEQLSKMMRQYLDIKEQYQDCIIFFRLGDFYEMFFDDAKTASKELDLTLTGRACGLSEKAPMCGVPFHSYETYAARLIKKGYKVAICEQMEDPALCKDIVKREIVRIITPGTVIEGSMLDEARNNYICSLFLSEKNVGVCFADISVGELSVTMLPATRDMSSVILELTKFSPSELIINKRLGVYGGLYTFLREKLHATVDVFDESDYDLEKNRVIVEKKFGKSAIQLGFLGKEEALSALGKLLSYIESTQGMATERFSDINFYNDEQYMLLDVVARYNLELCETMRTGSKKGSLLWVLDDTKTAAGKRLLRSYIEKPLINSAVITKRLNAVSELYNDTESLEEIRDKLSGIFDLERIMTRVVCKTIAPKEMRSLYDTLAVLPALRRMTEKFNSRFLRDIHDEIDTLEDMAEFINSAIADDPSALLKDGKVIREGYNATLDEYRDLLDNAGGHLTAIEQRERERTGIKNLRTGYNRVFGYYIEVTNSFKDKVPENYIRKQTLTGAERYINEELKEIETKILDASNKVSALENELYNEVRDKIALELARFQKTASAIARLDVFCSLAKIARDEGYVEPTINLNGVIDIKDGRHPVVEKLSSGGMFIPNDTYLDNNTRISVITGPNMAGKSTYMRQTAIIVLMSHIGSFVPASYADICITDAIYTRVGASDDLSAGQSTFMVEMTELSNILKHATKNSLLILDEIGRGTSTFDGMSIAKASLEYIADKKKLGAKCMFATHYHELSEMEDAHDCIKNYNVAVKKHGDDIIFLRKIIRGHADDSYGIEVAKLADLPNSVIDRAHEILNDLEKGIIVTGVKSQKNDDGMLQTSFELDPYRGVISKLQDMSIDTLSPIEALNILYELKKMAE